MAFDIIGTKAIMLTCRIIVGLSVGYIVSTLYVFSQRPDLFDYDELIAVNDSEYSLLHAFHIANSNFGIAKLLDPEGK